jgi:hypothetical protein
MQIWWPERESNLRHADFQSAALPTELSGQREIAYNYLQVAHYSKLKHLLAQANAIKLKTKVA